jgi:hypothetical protein
MGHQAACVGAASQGRLALRWQCRDASGELIEWGAWAEACDRGAAMTIGQAGKMISCSLSLPFPLYLIRG